MQTVTGETEEASGRLRMLFCLGELERQAEMFGRSFLDAMRVALPVEGDQTDVWRHLQSALFAGVIVNRLLRGASPEQVRAAQLRELVCLTGEDGQGSPILELHHVRNSLEHIDERIDTYLASPGVTSLADCYLSDGHYLVSADGSRGRPEKAGLRAFNPDLGLLHFDRESLDMFRLDLHMLTLKHNTRDAQLELCQEVRGRQKFGGGQMVRWAERNSGNSGGVRAWRHERERREAAMAQPVQVEDYRIKLWLEPTAS